MTDSQDSLFRTVGDFRVARGTVESAEDDFRGRPEEDRRADTAERAPVTTEYPKWRSDQDTWDYPSVDTPREKPRVLPKDLMVDDKPRTTDPATGGSRAARTHSPQGLTASNTAAPITETAQLAATDISLAPEEAFEGVGAVDPQAIGGFNKYAPGESGETDRPDRENVPPDILRGDHPDIDDPRSELRDDRPRERQLTEFGMNTDATQHREGRQDEPAASSFGVDDRERIGREPDSGDDGEQSGLERFGGGVRENETLF